MRKQIVISLSLIIIGIVLGFFVVVNWQLAQEIKKTEAAIAQDGQKLDAIEKYLNDVFPPVNAQQQPSDQTN